eukprot:5694803-Amphidinium_carterae.2
MNQYAHLTGKLNPAKRILVRQRLHGCLLGWSVCFSFKAHDSVPFPWRRRVRERGISTTQQITSPSCQTATLEKTVPLQAIQDASTNLKRAAKSLNMIAPKRPTRRLRISSALLADLQV